MTLMDKDGNPTACKYLYHKKPSERPWAQNLWRRNEEPFREIIFRFTESCWILVTST